MNHQAPKEPQAAQSHRYKVEGMDCASCVTKIETALTRLPGVSGIRANAATETLSACFADDGARLKAEAQVAALGYGLRPLQAKGSSTKEQESHSVPWWRTRRALLTGACGVSLLAAYGIGKAIPSAEQWSYAAALGIGLVPIARRAFSAARAGSPFSIEMLMSIAAIGAVAIGAIEEAATVVFLFLVGELLEGVAAGRARASIQSLSALIPKTALRVAGDTNEEVPADTLEVGDIILVRPGDRISADGEIIAGETEVNEAPVTGESVPKRKKTGDKVFAGTVNGDAVLRVRVTAAAADNTIARVIQLVEEAQESKAPTERFIDRFSRYYTPGVVAFAALVAAVPPLFFGGAWDEWIYKGLATLLIGCPCALVISTPAAIAAALSSGARRGLLMKGGGVLESAGKLTTIAFDKTGTLTEGKPKVTDVVPLGRSAAEVMSLTAALESGSNHPLALAILDHAKKVQAPIPPVSDASAVPGKGITGNVGGNELFFGSMRGADERSPLSTEIKEQVGALHDDGKTVSVLMVGGSPGGLIAMRDEPRADAKAGLAALHEAGVRTIMLTGDNARTASAIGKALNIEVRGDLLPQDKLKIIEDLKTRGETVGKVGDGINDAPALAAADVGIAMGSGTDVALETADAAILHGRVKDVSEMMALSRACMTNIYQNIGISLGLKAVFLGTTLAGITGLWPAILADTGATVLVTANALRLLRYSGPRP